MAHTSSICSSCGRDGLDEFIVEIPSSPVPELLNNNQPPSLLETALARTAIEDISLDLRRLEEEASRVRSVLNELEKCRDALRNQRRNHEGVLSSIRKIPPETLGKIFLASLPENLEGYHEPITCSVPAYRWGWAYREAVINIGQVCRRWRDVSTRTPQLWSRMSLQLDGISRWQPDAAEKLETWLQRSGEVPLQAHGSLFGPSIQERWEPILKRAHRWQDADLVLGRCCWDKVSIYFHRMPLLETLTVEFIDDTAALAPAGAEKESGWNIQIDAPALRSLHVSLRDYYWELPNIQLPSSQLRMLDLHMIDGPSSASEQRIMSMLREAQNLVSCLLDFPSQFDGPSDATSTPSVQPHPSAIHFPYLRYLNIRGDGPLRIIHFLHTPVLTEFVCSANRHPWPSSALMSLISRSRCTIQKISYFLNGVEESSVDGEFLECLQMMPDLKSLEIRDFGNDAMNMEPLIQRLNRKEEACLVPGLATLKMRVPVTVTHIESFVDMIESRVKPREDGHSDAALDDAFDVLETVELIQVQIFQFDSEPEEREARLRAAERLVRLKAKGTEILTLSHYGYAEIPVEDIFLAAE